jgi:hypothetical protein
MEHAFTPLGVRRFVGLRRGGERQAVPSEANGGDYRCSSRGPKGATRLPPGIFVHSTGTITLSIVVVMAILGRKF